MAEKRIIIVLAVGLILCNLSGCSKNSPTGEMVENISSCEQIDVI